MYEIGTEDVYEDFNSDKEMFDISHYSTNSKYYDDSNKLIIGRMNDETGGVAIEKFVRLKPKIHSFLVDGNREHKKAKDVNRNVVKTIIQNEYKDVMLSNKCMRHSMNSCSLPFAHWSKLFARCSLLLACCSLLFARCSLLLARCSLLFACSSLLFACCLLLFARCLLLFARCMLLYAHCFLLFDHCSLLFDHCSTKKWFDYNETPPQIFPCKFLRFW